MTILSPETASDYVRRWHAASGELVTIESAVPATVNEEVPAIRVAAIRPAGDLADWYVWQEPSGLYGEW